MIDNLKKPTTASELKERAIAVWDNEGGAASGDQSRTNAKQEIGMASEWVKCTSDDGETGIFVNLASAGTIVPHKKGSRITFAVIEENCVDVMETPEDIMKLLSEAKNANRP